MQKNKGKKFHSTNFLSFSKSEQIAKCFLGRGKNGNSYGAKFFLTQPRQNDDTFVNNIEMRHYSGLAHEREVLFLPDSCFAIKRIQLDNGRGYHIIYLEYIGVLSC